MVRARILYYNVRSYVLMLYLLFPAVFEIFFFRRLLL